MKVCLIQNLLILHTTAADIPTLGGPDYAAACDYILNRFVSLNQAETKQIYTHFTCATDTTQIRFVMGAVNGKSICSIFVTIHLIPPQTLSSKKTSECAVSYDDCNIAMALSYSHFDLSTTAYTTGV